MVNDIRTLVSGCGSIGRRHIENLLSLGMNSVVVFDPNDAMLEKMSDQFEGVITALHSFEDRLMVGTESSLYSTGRVSPGTG